MNPIGLIEQDKLVSSKESLAMLLDKGLCSQDCVFGFGLHGSELGEKNGNGPYTKQNRIYNLKKKAIPDPTTIRGSATQL